MSTHYGFGRRLTLTLGLLAVCAGGSAMVAQKQNAETARLITPPAKTNGWKILNEVAAQSGATIPADTNVVFHLPLDMEQTTREVLLGHEGKDVAYWGYCFDDNFDETSVKARLKFGQLPGKMFLSEKERADRAAAYEKTKPTFSVTNLPTQDELDAAAAADSSPIRHQLDTFDPGMICYIMSSEPLAFGVDSDNDLLNNKIEHALGTEIGEPDTDKDAISDGVEYLHNLMPLVRDTDGDGLVDGTEDKNWNGLTDGGETDPKKRDSDKDGLCDGVCRIKLARNNEVFIGEDANLNGIVDAKETDPLRWSTPRNGISDYQAYLNCKLGQTSFCIK